MSTSINKFDRKMINDIIMSNEYYSIAIYLHSYVHSSITKDIVFKSKSRDDIYTDLMYILDNFSKLSIYIIELYLKLMVLCTSKKNMNALLKTVKIQYYKLNSPWYKKWKYIFNTIKYDDHDEIVGIEDIIKSINHEHKR